MTYKIRPITESKPQSPLPKNCHGQYVESDVKPLLTFYPAVIVIYKQHFNRPTEAIFSLEHLTANEQSAVINDIVKFIQCV